MNVLKFLIYLAYGALVWLEIGTIYALVLMAMYHMYWSWPFVAIVSANWPWTMLAFGHWPYVAGAVFVLSIAWRGIARLYGALRTL